MKKKKKKKKPKKTQRGSTGRTAVVPALSKRRTERIPSKLEKGLRKDLQGVVDPSKDGIKGRGRLNSACRTKGEKKDQ